MMAYLQPAEYPSYGLPSATTQDWVAAATALINSHCRRPDLNVTQYTERLRVTEGAGSVRLTYLPLAVSVTSLSPLVAMEGRYTRGRRGEMPSGELTDIACAFGLPGQWTALNLQGVDVDNSTGELTLPWNVLGLPFTEVAVTYTAGLVTIGDDVKVACAQIVRNAQAQPSLNTSRAHMDTMQMQYFSSSLLDDTVRDLLRPYVANRLG